VKRTTPCEKRNNNRKKIIAIKRRVIAIKREE
jgi:hypothetical protein